MTADRLSYGYQPDWDIDLAIGKQGELLAGDVARGLTEGTVEVKTDERSETTGNIYVEYECRGRPSGIATTKATWWAYALARRRVLVVLPTDLLLNLAREQWRDGYQTECSRGSYPTRGVLIPVNELIPRAIVLAQNAA